MLVCEVRYACEWEGPLLLWLTGPGLPSGGNLVAGDGAPPNDGLWLLWLNTATWSVPLWLLGWSECTCHCWVGPLEYPRNPTVLVGHAIHHVLYGELGVISQWHVTSLKRHCCSMIDCCNINLMVLDLLLECI